MEEVSCCLSAWWCMAVFWPARSPPLAVKSYRLHCGKALSAALWPNAVGCDHSCPLTSHPFLQTATHKQLQPWSKSSHELMKSAVETSDVPQLQCRQKCLYCNVQSNTIYFYCSVTTPGEKCLYNVQSNTCITVLLLQVKDACILYCPK